jgi:hypothetical protein
MSAETIVPFRDAAAKLANDNAKAERSELPRTGGEAPNIEAIENILKALEGMQTQVQALTDLVIEQDARIKALEKAKSKIIQVRN